MKVLYTFGGISHYLDALLNKQQEKGARIVTVIPEKGNATIGKGVHMVEGGRYKRVYAAEKTCFMESAHSLLYRKSYRMKSRISLSWVGLISFNFFSSQN